MTTTLYLPNQQPQIITGETLNLPDETTSYVVVQERVSVLLNCQPELVDVLASGQGYVAYSVFDSEQEINTMAMQAVEVLSGEVFDQEEEDSVLRGPVLVVTKF